MVFLSRPVIFFYVTVLLFRPICFYFFYFLDCAVDLDLLSNEDMERLRNGEIFKNESDLLSIKISLGSLIFTLTC